MYLCVLLLITSVNVIDTIKSGFLSLDPVMLKRIVNPTEIHFKSIRKKQIRWLCSRAKRDIKSHDIHTTISWLCDRVEVRKYILVQYAAFCSCTTINSSNFNVQTVTQFLWRQITFSLSEKYESMVTYSCWLNVKQAAFTLIKTYWQPLVAESRSASHLFCYRVSDLKPVTHDLVITCFSTFFLQRFSSILVAWRQFLMGPVKWRQIWFPSKNKNDVIRRNLPILIIFVSPVTCSTDSYITQTDGTSRRETAMREKIMMKMGAGKKIPLTSRCKVRDQKKKKRGKNELQ